MSRVVRLCRECARYHKPVQLAIFAPAHECKAPSTCECTSVHVVVIPDDEVVVLPDDPPAPPA